jgi:hypothetical protein
VAESHTSCAFEWYIFVMCLCPMMFSLCLCLSAAVPEGQLRDQAIDMFVAESRMSCAFGLYIFSLCLCLGAAVPGDRYVCSGMGAEMHQFHLKH